MQFIEKRKKINFLKRVTYLSKAFIPYVKSNKLKSINIYRDYIYSFKSIQIIKSYKSIKMSVSIVKSSFDISFEFWFTMFYEYPIVLLYRLSK